MHKQLGKIYISNDMILVLEHLLHQILVPVQYADSVDRNIMTWNRVGASSDYMLVDAKCKIRMQTISR